MNPTINVLLPLIAALMFETPAGMRRAHRSADKCFYKDEMFKEDDIITTTDRYPDGNNGYQAVDIYTAKGDQREARPALLMIHGGSYTGGNTTTSCTWPVDWIEVAKSDEEKGTQELRECTALPKFATKAAQLGYVVFSIDYTLMGPSPFAMMKFAWNLLVERKNKDAIKAARDARAAVRWIKRNADDLGVDPEKIAMMGDSAGAITTLWANYRTEKVEIVPKVTRCCCRDARRGERECDILQVDELQKSFHPLKFRQYVCPRNWDYSLDGCEGQEDPYDGIDGDVAAAISLSGTLSFAQIGGPDFTKSICSSQTQAPLLVVHATGDETIPFKFGQQLFERAQEVGLPSQMITVPDSWHIPYTELMDADPNQKEFYFDKFKGFLSETLKLGCK